MRTFADQAVIAIENTRLLTELRESLDRQTATAEVLGVISASPGDLEPVFQAILDNAVRLCRASQGSVFRVEGETLRRVAAWNLPDELVAMNVPAVADTPFGRMMRTGRTVHVPNLPAEIPENPGPEWTAPRAAAERAGVRTVLWVPLSKDGVVLGACVLNRDEVRPFSPKEIELVENFAKQAAIAVENARLLTELRDRTADLQQSLEYQTATSDVLKVISRSTFDLEPVLQYVLDTAMRLCHAVQGSIFRQDGTQYRWAVGQGLDPVYAEIERTTPIVPGEGTLVGRAASRRQTVQIADAWDDPLYAPKDDARITVARTMLGVPLLREGVPVGVIAMARKVVEPFTDKEIDLVTTFADQAAIAIENTRLLTETREALEKQTATAEILRVISASPNDLQPTFDAIADRVKALFGDVSSGVFPYDGALIHVGAHRGIIEAESAAVRDVFPLPPSRATIAARAVLTRQVAHIVDPKHDPDFAHASLTYYGTLLAVPMLREGKCLGAIAVSRQHVEPFTEAQIDLLKTFADSAVIAIENVRLFTELNQRTSDLQESLDYQTATSDVLKVISRSTFDLQPVLDTLLQTAGRLCKSDAGGLSIRDGEVFRYHAVYGFSDDITAFLRQTTFLPNRGSIAGRTALAGKVVQFEDIIADPDYEVTAAIASGEAHAALGVPMLREGRVVGTFSLTRNHVEPFTERQIELVRTFADQAVIAIENARLLTELRESLEQQQAIAELLQVINASPGNLAPVFDAILDKAHTLCGASRGSLFIIEGDTLRAAATRGYPADLEARLRESAPLAGGRLFAPLLDGARLVHHPDLLAIVPSDSAIIREVVARGAVRTNLILPLRKDNALLGFISCNRAEVRPFAEGDIALLESFAAQAVIAMDNARLLSEIRQRQAELSVTFENMGDAVIMFDGQQRLVAWNRNFLHMLDISEDWLATPRSYRDFADYLTARGEFGDASPPDLGAPDRGEVRPIRYERTRPDGRVLEVRRNPIPGGAGFVFIYADITERKRAEENILAAREAAERALADLKLAQANLIQAEKMASLGQLTAGIAHEIKNPLNFVNNFANLSNELLGELKETAAPAFATLDADARDAVDETLGMLTGNLEKIQEHGKRADGIVKSMLAHSRGGSGDRREADINALVEESLNLAYHGARAQDQNFNITLERDYDKTMRPIELVPQDVTRVFLNLCGNGFYAANKRRKEGGDAGFRPVLKIATKELGDAVEVRIRDNGTGIPPEVRAKLFQPFFTTKPTGEGTGLGLSISYDIVTQQHGGTIAVDSRVGDFTEFAIRLPRKR